MTKHRAKYPKDYRVSFQTGEIRSERQVKYRSQRVYIFETKLWESNKYYILVCVCMLTRACVLVGNRARERVYAHTCIEPC
jgi:hypothetical protein